MNNTKWGYTTGSCAAAASKIAVKTLFSGIKCHVIKIDTPKGLELTIDANYTNINSSEVTSYVIKNYSDDPDVTRGIKIYATARKIKPQGIIIKGGIGVGVVTKKGLSVPIGEPAINPVPRKMILDEVGKVLPMGQGVEITIFAPEGLEIAKKTFNSKLGIIGGISILGTTGIVIPMSQDAYKESLKLELNVLFKNSKSDKIIFIFGNYGKDYLNKYNISEDRTQKTSNFIKYMIESGMNIGYKNILIVGHAGKMVKVAYGMENTHSKYGDNRMESIKKSCNGVPGIDLDIVLGSNTTDEVIEYLKSAHVEKTVFMDIASRCKKVCQNWVDNKIDIECLIFTNDYGEISSSKNAHSLLKEFQK